MAARWKIHPNLAWKLVTLRRAMPVGVSIISGYRSPEEQNALREAGRPTAANDRSTHLSCPATGADLRVHAAELDDAVKIAFGVAAVSAGLRWGGGSAVNDKGIPSDWNHVDMGPR